MPTPIGRRGVGIAVVFGAIMIVGTSAGPAAAQIADSAFRGAFVGRVLSSLDSSPARSVEIRLLFVDSSKAVRGSDALDIFVDSTRTRVGVTDSTGAFSIRRLAAGHYLMRLRRIGFVSLEGGLSVGSDTVRTDLVMQVVSQTLAQMTIRETTADVVKIKLDRVGFVDRSRYGAAGTFLDRKEILKRRRDTLGQLLGSYGIHSGDVILDRMPLQFEDIRDYPADLVIGIEIYRRSRPTEFNMTRRPSNGVFATHGVPAPTVLVWTYIPGG